MPTHQVTDFNAIESISKAISDAIGTRGLGKLLTLDELGSLVRCLMLLNPQMVGGVSFGLVRYVIR